jgi:hypothetical protein
MCLLQTILFLFQINHAIVEINAEVYRLVVQLPESSNGALDVLLPQAASSRAVILELKREGGGGNMVK